MPPPKLQLGLRVSTRMTGNAIGVIQFIGPLPSKGPGEYIGVVFSAPVADSTGTHGGVKYFDCPVATGVFALPGDVVVHSLSVPLPPPSKSGGPPTIISHQFPDGSVYEGEWSGNGDTVRFHGKGSFTSQQGIQYTGSYADGGKHGEGVLQTPSGSFRGVWDRNIPHTQTNSEIILAGGSAVYRGGIKQGCMSSVGAVQYAVGNGEYQGQWANGAKDGEGTYSAHPSLRYQGAWQKGVPHGLGTLTTGTHTFHGTFLHGVPHGDVTHTVASPNGTSIVERYTGGWHEGVRFGHGTLTTSTYEYEGAFLYGLRHGAGKCRWMLHSIEYDGGWAKDVFHGYGTMRLADGSVLEGRWENGSLCVDSTTQVMSSGERKKVQVRVVPCT